MPSMRWRRCRKTRYRGRQARLWRVRRFRLSSRAEDARSVRLRCASTSRNYRFHSQSVDAEASAHAQASSPVEVGRGK